MNGSVLQQGTCDKHPIFIQMLIEELSKLGAVVVAITISTELISSVNLYIHVSTTTHHCFNDSSVVCIVH